MGPHDGEGPRSRIHMIKDGIPYCDICGEEIPLTEEYGRFKVPADKGRQRAQACILKKIPAAH